jgi:transcriptional regulator with XRE-family HTH domain
MAEALGVGQSYVSKLERGENFVDVLLFARWCSMFGLRVKPGKTLDKLIGMQI